MYKTLNSYKAGVWGENSFWAQNRTRPNNLTKKAAIHFCSAIFTNTCFVVHKCSHECIRCKEKEISVCFNAKGCGCPAAEVSQTPHMEYIGSTSCNQIRQIQIHKRVKLVLKECMLPTNLKSCLICLCSGYVLGMILHYYYTKV